jgi:IclR family transcriptional regulator, pca regulon regulatory protein
LAVLRCFSAKRALLGIADISEELQMHRSTTHRYVTTLVALGYLEQGASRKYRLGSRVTDLGLAVLDATGLRDRSREYLEDLCAQTGCAASLGVLNGGEVVYLEHVLSFRHREGWMDLTLMGPGSRLPADRTAIGKVLLGEDFAVDDEQFAPGLVSVAVPVRDESREVIAAAGLTGTTSTISLQELSDKFSPQLISTADRISERLGYRGDEQS